MPMLLPDKTGTVYKLWMLCGVVKCYGYILTNTWAVCTSRRASASASWSGDSWSSASASASSPCSPTTSACSTTAPSCRRTGSATMFHVAHLLRDRLHGHHRRAARPRQEVPRPASLDQSPDTSFDQQVLAATISIMVGADSGFREILSAALRSLRCVSMADVTWDEFKENTPNPKCYSKSRAVSFKEIDYFISHSWSDDPHAKWAAVQEMRTTFKTANGREPLVWFDKYCIDQNAIGQSVRRLPIFVVAGGSSYVLLGPSYATRLWCMLELFVFKACQRCGLFSDAELVIAPLRTNETNLHLSSLAQKFNIHDTRCFRDVDRQTIFGIVETAGDGAIGFTEAVRSLAKAAGEQVGGEMPPVSEMPGASDAPTAKLRRRASGASAPPSPPAPPRARTPPRRWTSRWALTPRLTSLRSMARLKKSSWLCRSPRSSSGSPRAQARVVGGCGRWTSGRDFVPLGWRLVRCRCFHWMSRTRSGVQGSGLCMADCACVCVCVCHGGFPDPSVLAEQEARAQYVRIA